jgi:hypothetical protein
MINKNKDKADVGTYIVTRCSRCDHDMNHVVVAKGADGSVARVKCLVCGSEHNYHHEAVKKASSVRAPKLTSAPRSSSSKLFEEAKQGAVNKVPVNYTISDSYPNGTLILHSNWGEGVVFKVFDDKIEVVFRDAVRTLVQNRK